MSGIVFNDRDMFSRSQGEAILDKQEETLNQLVGRMLSFPPPPLPLNNTTTSPSPPLARVGSGVGLGRQLSEEEQERKVALETKLRKRGSVYVMWHNVASSEEWLGAIQSLSLPHFSAMFGESHLFLSSHPSLLIPSEQIKCQRCSFAQSLDDPSIFITLLWLNDNGGTLFELFMKEQLASGGVYFQAAEDELISGPFESLQFINESHVGWETEILPNDILNMVSFKTRSYPSQCPCLASISIPYPGQNSLAPTWSINLKQLVTMGTCSRVSMDHKWLLPLLWRMPLGFLSITRQMV
jgi:hypothetical protein